MPIETPLSEKIQNMILEIPPEGRDGFTRENARFIANMMLMINETSGCAVFQAEDIDHVKFMRRWFMRCMAGIGVAVTAGIGVVVVWLLKGFGITGGKP